MTVFEMIEAQQQGLEDTTVYMVGQQLKDICRADLACAAIVAEDLQQKEMSIAACEKKIKAKADAIAKDKKLRGVGISPDTAEKIIREFYGLPENCGASPVPTQTGTTIFDLDDLL